MGNDRITIGITAFREGVLLNRCWQSVLNQTLTVWDAMLVLDGGADEETTKIFDSIEDSRLTKIKLATNIGPYPTRELIFENSRNDIVLYIDADDAFMPEAAEKVLSIFSDPAIEYAGVGARIIFEDGKQIIIRGHQTTIEKLLLNGDFPGYLLFRRSVWKKLGGYHPSLRRGKADMEFCLKILKNRLNGYFAQQILIQKDERSGSVSRSYGERIGEIHELIVDSHPDIFLDEALRSKFLGLGYYVSATARFQHGDADGAAEQARRVAALSGPRVVWPLQYADRLPRSVVMTLMTMRLYIGRLLRGIGLLKLKGIASQA